MASSSRARDHSHCRALCAADSVRSFPRHGGPEIEVSSSAEYHCPTRTAAGVRVAARHRLDTGATPASCETGKYRRWKYNATLTSEIMPGTSTSGPITAAKAAPELMPNTDTATAIASSKLFEAAVKESVVVLE